jgi:hypothetical protein
MNNPQSADRIYTLPISEYQSIQGTREQLIDRLAGGLLSGHARVAAWVDARLDANKRAV